MKEKDDTNKAWNANEPATNSPHDVIKPGEYLRAVKLSLRKGNQKEAFSLLQDANLQYPDDPFILSYYGCLQALVDKKYRAGVDKCKQALSMIKKESSFGEDMLYPVFYLNLGRAYVAAGKKKDALDAFGKGLKYDNSNHDILMEMQGLGSRKKAPVPFLDRSNPINKCIGLVLRKATEAPDKKR
jgi:tetratricopeptide (TPR) repeat protein